MPQVNQSPGDFLLNAIKTLQQQVSDLAMQQNFAVIDQQGHVRVVVGLLANGDYGLNVNDANGVVTEILPVYFMSTAGPVTISTSLHDLGLPSRTVIVGASGNVKVTVSGQISPNGTSSGYAGAFLSVSVDGATPAGVLLGMTGFFCPANIVGIGIGSACSTTVVVTGLTPGSHVLTVQGAAVGNGAVVTNLYAQYEPI